MMSLCAMQVHAQEELTDTLKEVVITGTGTQHLLKNAPVQTEVITRKMLDSYGGKSIEEILGGLTASFAFNEGDMGSQIQLGGLGNSYILILMASVFMAMWEVRTTCRSSIPRTSRRLKS